MQGQILISHFWYLLYGKIIGCYICAGKKKKKVASGF